MEMGNEHIRIFFFVKNKILWSKHFIFWRKYTLFTNKRSPCDLNLSVHCHAAPFSHSKAHIFKGNSDCVHCTTLIITMEKYRKTSQVFSQLTNNMRCLSCYSCIERKNSNEMLVFKFKGLQFNLGFLSSSFGIVKKKKWRTKEKSGHLK